MNMGMIVVKDTRIQLSFVNFIKCDICGEVLHAVNNLRAHMKTYIWRNCKIFGQNSIVSDTLTTYDNRPNKNDACGTYVKYVVMI